MAIAVAKSVPFGAIFTFQLVSKLNSVLDTAREYYEHTQTVRELSQLSDAQLDDIGVSRSELNRRAKALR